MKSKKFKIISALLTVGLLFQANLATVYAVSPEILNKIALYEEKIQHLDGEIDKATIESKELNKNINKSETEISDSQIKIKEKEKEIKNNNDIVQERARTIYINNYSVSFLDVLLSSKGIGDMVSRLDNLNTIIKYDEENINKLKESSDNLQLLNTSLNSKKNSLALSKKLMDKKLSELKINKNSQEKILNDLNTIISDEIKQKQVAFNNEAMGSLGGNEIYSLSRGISPNMGNVLNFGSKFLGTPYVWGGTSPSGFDCSGFTQYVFGNSGVSLNRIASEQQQQGYVVSKEQAKPGDLVFFGLPAHHVGIYAGNGMMLHAPRSGDVVKFAPINWSNVSNIKRV